MDSYDLIVVGAGAAGLLAATAARRLGESVLVVDADQVVGGATAGTGGSMWLPANEVAQKLATDSVAEADEYLAALLGPVSLASSAERRAGFTRTAPRLVRWLTGSNIPLNPLRGVCDERPELPGGKPQGRVLAAGPIERRVLGDWDDQLRSAAKATGRLPGLPFRRRTTNTPGESLVGHLLHRATANGVTVWLNSTVTDLILQADRVTGLVIRRDGVETELRAARVILASGGFEHSQGLREEYLPLPTSTSWTTSAAANTGSLLRLAVARGAATACLDDAWWLPVMVAEGSAWTLEGVRNQPHSLIVDAAGDRFLDECLPANAAGRALYNRHRGVRSVPSFLILDNRHRQAHDLGPWAAGSNPRKAQEAGEIFRAQTLNDLAELTGIDRAGLIGSVVRFNGFVPKGKDLDFGRGEKPSAGGADTGRRRGSTLGKLDKPPFWAVKVYPGDAGTKGGLLIDATARVLRPDGTVLEGLYACGGAAASLFHRACPGPGAGLSAALVEAFLAATHGRN